MNVVKGLKKLVKKVNVKFGERWNKIEEGSQFFLKWAIWNFIPTIAYFIYMKSQDPYFWVNGIIGQTVIFFWIYIWLLIATLCTLIPRFALVGKFDFRIYGLVNGIIMIITVIL